MEKSKLYKVNNRLGQYELTTENGKECFWMYDTDQYEYFEKSTITEPSKKEVKEISEP